MKLGKELLYLSRADVEHVGLGMTEIIDALELAFAEKGAGRVEMPPKPGIHPRPDAFIHAMPAWIPSLNAAGIKWVSGDPGNKERGLPYVNGLIVLNDPETGIPLAVMDATWITAMRTAAATAVAARRLARADSRTLGVIACGVQGRTNLEALRCLFAIERVVAFDIHPEMTDRYAEEMAAQHGIEVVAAREPRAAVEGLDLVVTSGRILKTPEPSIEPGWLAEGAFAAALDFDSTWSGAAMREVDRLATDDAAQLRYYREEGYFADTPEPYADLGELVAGSKPGRGSDAERTFAMNLGLALEDMATAIRVYERALDAGVGSRLLL